MTDTLPMPTKTLISVKLYQTYMLERFLTLYWLQDILSTLTFQAFKNEQKKKKRLDKTTKNLKRLWNNMDPPPSPIKNIRH